MPVKIILPKQIITSEMLPIIYLSLKKKNGPFCKEVKKSYVVLDPQPDPSTIVTVKRKYSCLGRNNNYKKKKSNVVRVRSGNTRRDRRIHRSLYKEYGTRKLNKIKRAVCSNNHSPEEYNKERHRVKETFTRNKTPSKYR